jgi:hypothetical protein
MINSAFPTPHFPGPRSVAIILASWLIAISGPANEMAYGQVPPSENPKENNSDPSKSAVDVYREFLSGPTAEQALEQLAKRIEGEEHDFNRSRELYGEKDPRVIHAQLRLHESRKLFAIQKKLLELSKGQLDENKQAEMFRLRNEMSELLLKQMRKTTSPSAVDGPLDSIQQTLRMTTQQLQLREKQIQELQQQLSKLERDRALPPLENGQVKVYSLSYAKARDAASTISSLFGPQAVRVAIDDRTNSLVVFGKDDSLPVLDALLQRLDSQAAPDKAGKQSVETTGGTRRSVLLRLFCLADNIRDGGQSADEYLPEKVLAAVQKLGLIGPRLISQNVTSLSISTKGAVEFSSDVPVVINGQPANLSTSGKIQLADDDDERAELQMKIQMTLNPGLQSAVQGSLATPLGHYMVLGTANSLTADEATMQAMAFQQGMMGPGGPTVRRGASGRGEFGGPRTGAFGELGAAAPEGGAPIPGDEPAKPTFETSRFAFVVQVVNAESYAGGETKSPKAESGDEPSWEERAKEK